MKTIKLSVTEYATLRKISRQAVIKRLTPETKPMPYVMKVEKIGKTWVLYVDNSINDKS